MTQYINKDALVAEIEKLMDEIYAGRPFDSLSDEQQTALWYVKSIMSSINTLEVKEVNEQCVQYDSIKAGIQAHAETYSFNIESELFNQLTKEQQKLWRKEIEQACISGGEMGIELARDIRYKENVEVKEVDLEKEIDNIWNPRFNLGWDEKSLLEMNHEGFTTIAKHFFELGLKAKTDKELVEEIYSHIDSIKDTADRMTSGNFMHNRAAIKFSANTIAKVLELMGLKAQKGEGV